MEEKLKGVHQNYLWSWGTENFRIAYATPKKWLEELRLWSWFLCVSYTKVKGGKALQLTVLGINLGYKFKTD